MKISELVEGKVYKMLPMVITEGKLYHGTTCWKFTIKDGYLFNLSTNEYATESYNLIIDATFKGVEDEEVNMWQGRYREREI